MEFFGNYNLNFLIIRNFLDNKEILFRVHKKKKRLWIIFKYCITSNELDKDQPKDNTPR